jgi:hypothetical protein
MSVFATAARNSGSVMSSMDGPLTADRALAAFATFPIADPTVHEIFHLFRVHPI